MHRLRPRDSGGITAIYTILEAIAARQRPPQDQPQ